MPAKVSKKGNKYQVKTPHMVHAKGTTKEKAMAQARLINAIDHGYKPSGTDYDVPMKTAQEYLEEKRSEIYRSSDDWEANQKRIEKEIGDPTVSNIGDLSNRPVGAVVPGTDSIIRMKEEEVVGCDTSAATAAYPRGSNASEAFPSSPQDSAVAVGGTGQAAAAAPYARDRYNARKA